MRKRVHNTGRIAIGYCRCSTEEQQRSSSELNTLEAQEQMIREYCSRSHPDWVLEVAHEVRSAKDMNRPELQRILQRVQSGEVAALIVYRLDRLARSVKDLLAISEQLERHGVELVSLREQIDTSTPIGRLFFTLMGLLAQFEREVIAERIADKMRAMSAQGIWVRGRVPFGYRLNRETRRLEINPDAAPWVRWMFERFVQTGSVGRVARELHQNEEFRNLRRRMGYQIDRFWTDKLVANILVNKIYLGHTVYGGEVLCEHTHPPIIDAELFERVQALLPSNRIYRPQYSPATQEDPYLLRGSVYCRECGAQLTPYWVRGNKLTHYYTHPRRTPCSFRWVNAERLHRAVWRALGTIAELDGVAEQALFAAESAAVAQARREVQRLGWEIDRLLELARAGVGDVPELSRQLAHLQTRRAELAREVRVVDVDAVRSALDAFRRALQGWNRIYEQATLQERRELFGLLVSRVEVERETAHVWVPVGGMVRNSGGTGGAYSRSLEPSILLLASSPLDLRNEVMLRLK